MKTTDVIPTSGARRSYSDVIPTSGARRNPYLVDTDSSSAIASSLAAAPRRQRMHVHDRVATVQILPHRLEVGVAGPAIAVVVGINADAVGLQGVEAVLDLLHDAFDVGQRNGSEGD